jgi:hypothetical protein
MATDNQAAPIDFLGMSDEELMNVNPASLVLAAPGEQSDDAADKEVDDVTQSDDQGDHDLDDKDDGATDDDKQDDADDGKGAGDEDDKADDSAADVAIGADDAKGTADKDAANPDSKAAPAKTDATKAGTEVKEGDDAAKSGTEGAKDDSVVIDFEAEYKKLFAPIKANGREIQVKSVDDAISLMQMGANYNKKMSALKPNLKLMKMLEQAGLLDESKLNFLIDLDKKDPAAISKLVMDSKLDPLDLSTDKAAEYKQGNHAVDERSMELDVVMEELKGSKHYTRTLEVVSSEWDQASKGQVVSNPGIMTVINGHMESGIYDRIQKEIDSERTFGRLKGLSDLEAYRQVGDAIDARGGFKDLFTGSTQEQSQAAPAAKVIVTPKPKQADEGKLKDLKRAASGTKTVVPGKGVPADFNPLGMSDEDFAKFKPI